MSAANAPGREGRRRCEMARCRQPRLDAPDGRVAVEHRVHARGEHIGRPPGLAVWPVGPSAAGVQPRTRRLYVIRWGRSAAAPSVRVAVLLVGVEVALEPRHLRVALEGQHVGGDTVQEPAVVGDHHRAAGEFQQRVLQRAQRVDVEVVGGLVEQQQVAAASAAAWRGARGCARRRRACRCGPAGRSP